MFGLQIFALLIAETNMVIAVLAEYASFAAMVGIALSLVALVAQANARQQRETQSRQSRGWRQPNPHNNWGRKGFEYKPKCPFCGYPIDECECADTAWGEALGMSDY